MDRIKHIGDYSYLNDIRVIQHSLFLHGFDATLSQCQELWEEYSDDRGAGWLMNDWSDVEGVWDQTKDYIKESYIKEEYFNTDKEFEDTVLEDMEDVKSVIESDDEYRIAFEVKRIAENPYRGFAIFSKIGDITEEVLKNITP